MTRDELIGLGQRILAEEDDEVLDSLMAEFDRNVPHPKAAACFSTPKGGTPAAAAWRITRPRRKKWWMPVWPTARFACKTAARSRAKSLRSLQNLPKPPLLATIPPGCCPEWQTKPN